MGGEFARGCRRRCSAQGALPLSAEGAHLLSAPRPAARPSPPSCMRRGSAGAGALGPGAASSPPLSSNTSSAGHATDRRQQLSATRGCRGRNAAGTPNSHKHAPGYRRADASRPTSQLDQVALLLALGPCSPLHLACQSPWVASESRQPQPPALLSARSSPALLMHAPCSWRRSGAVTVWRRCCTSPARRAVFSWVASILDSQETLGSVRRSSAGR